MSEFEEVQDTTLAQQAEAEAALAPRSDPELRMAWCSRHDPVALFGAWGPKAG